MFPYLRGTLVERRIRQVNTSARSAGSVWQPQEVVRPGVVAPVQPSAVVAAAAGAQPSSAGVAVVR